MIHNLPTTFLPGSFQLTPGTAADYHALARFHYAPGPPATFAAVVCAIWRNPDRHILRPIVDNAVAPLPMPGCGERPGSNPTHAFVHEETQASRPAGSAARAAAWQNGFEEDQTRRLVGVVVLSYPSALHRTRHRVFGLRSMRFGERLRWVNANLRTVSRVIVHPQFRGIGLSTTLIRAAVAMCPTPFVEASARMGRAHPLFDRAGFNRADPLTAEEPIYFWKQQSPTTPPLNGGSPSAAP